MQVPQGYPGPSIDVLEVAVHTMAKQVGVSPSAVEDLLTVLLPLKTHNVETYAHSLRVGWYAANLASLEGLDAKLALHGGCAHDVGKTTVHNDTLRAANFTSSHYAQMKTHPYEGAKILAPTHLFSSFIAGLHHQFQPEPYGPTLDSLSPYQLPSRLRTSIITVAQLVAFCDFYDALTTRDNNKGLVENTLDQVSVQAVLTDHFNNPARITWILSADLVRQK
jgi:putative nucleotidyltransferase with HDIG domain